MASMTLCPSLCVLQALTITSLVEVTRKAKGHWESPLFDVTLKYRVRTPRVQH